MTAPVYTKVQTMNTVMGSHRMSVGTLTPDTGTYTSQGDYLPGFSAAGNPVSLGKFFGLGEAIVVLLFGGGTLIPASPLNLNDGRIVLYKGAVGRLVEMAGALATTDVITYIAIGRGD